MKVIDVKLDRSNVIDRYNYEQGKVFYLGFENEPTKQYSIMFSDWDWVKKHFGNDFEHLNDGRENEIANLKRCIELNVPMWELSNIISFENGIYKRYAVNSHGNPTDKIITYKPYQLSSGGKEQFEKNIAKGLIVLCRLVESVQLELDLK
jgi:hypothetical protein